MKIAEFGTPSQFHEKFTLRGREIVLRALSSEESQRLERIEIRPQPPMIVKPGSHPEHGPAVVYDADPRYRQDNTTWFRRHRARQVAASAGLTGRGDAAYSSEMTEQQLKAWSDDVTAMMLAHFTDEELVAAYQVVERLGDPLSKLKVEAAVKN